jgi:hypothetical protein
MVGKANSIIILKNSEVEKVVYYDLIFDSNNIPYSIDVAKIGSFSVCRLKYWDVSHLPAVDVDGNSVIEKVFELIEIFEECSYVEGQNDPSKLFSVGGDCQAFAVYFKKELDRVGCKNGFVPGEDHVFNWVVVKDRIAKVDLVQRYFGPLSDHEREELLKYRNDLKEVIDYVELG